MGWCVLDGSVYVLLLVGYVMCVCIYVCMCVCVSLICVLNEKTGSWRLFRDGACVLLGMKVINSNYICDQPRVFLLVTCFFTRSN